MSRHQIIPAVFLILQNSLGQFYLMRRYNTGFMDGKYSLPAGHLDGGETLKEALVRETKEETGLIIKHENLQLVHVHSSIIDDPERIGFFFVCTDWQGQPEILEPNKCDEAIWVDKDNLPENTISYVSDILKSYPNNNYSEAKV